MMTWIRLVCFIAMAGVLWIVAWIAVPGTRLVSLVQMAAFVIVLPWLISFVAYGPCALFVAIADLGKRRSDHVDVSARVLHTLGGLTWAAGIIGAVGTTIQLHMSISCENTPGDLGPYAIPLRAIPAMLVPPAFALIVRLTVYDPLARRLEHRGESDV